MENGFERKLEQHMSKLGLLYSSRVYILIFSIDYSTISSSRFLKLVLTF